ncbi:MAG TPA: ABC transporter ATP-binding protein [Vicinamibacteria bacterium]|nr:ABC transporter ATP-binding protein [Vicinamibacteria bacterium]
MSGTRDVVVRLSGLTKSYPTGFLHRGRRKALEDLSLEVERGEIFGYLGPNGSGKTTTIKLLMGLVFADHGGGEVLGRALADPAWKARVGYLPEHPYFYDYLTPFEYLDYVGRLSGLPRERRLDAADRLLELVALQDVRGVPVRRFSKGMAQRLGVAQALVGDPELVVLDEPMSGLDPIGRRLVRDVILGLKKQGKTVFFSTHILPDAEALCDRVAVLRDGRLVKAGRLDEILGADDGRLEVLASGGAAAPEAAASVERMGERMRLTVEDARLVELLGALHASGARVIGVSRVRRSLEDYFVQEMGTAQRGTWSDLG